MTEAVVLVIVFAVVFVVVGGGFVRRAVRLAEAANLERPKAEAYAAQIRREVNDYE